MVDSAGGTVVLTHECKEDVNIVAAVGQARLEGVPIAAGLVKGRGKAGVTFAERCTCLTSNV